MKIINEPKLKLSPIEIDGLIRAAGDVTTSTQTHALFIDLIESKLNHALEMGIEIGRGE